MNIIDKFGNYISIGFKEKDEKEVPYQGLDYEFLEFSGQFEGDEFAFEMHILEVEYFIKKLNKFIEAAKNSEKSHLEGSGTNKTHKGIPR